MQVFRRGHLPVMGEWFALPLLKHAGSKKIGDAVFDEIFHPVARELIGKCDAVLRIGGPSGGADDMVATGRKLGKTIFNALEPKIPKPSKRWRKLFGHPVDGELGHDARASGLAETAAQLSIDDQTARARGRGRRHRPARTSGR